MNRFELVIVGGGLAAARAIREYRAAGGSGSIALLSREQSLPYHRPPLSKRYLRGEVDRDGTLVEPQEFYDENGVELLLGTEVAAVDPRESAVGTADGLYGYGKLLLATGAQPRTLDVPGAGLPGVFSLRSVEDSTAIREAAGQARDAVVVGSGFIGMEVAASLTELGLDVSLVSRGVELFASLRSPEISDHLVALYRRRGVDVIRGDEVRAFHGGERLDTVELRSGRQARRRPGGRRRRRAAGGLVPRRERDLDRRRDPGGREVRDQRPRRLRRRRRGALLRPGLRPLAPDRALVERELPGRRGRQGPRRGRRRLRRGLDVLHRVVRAAAEGLRRHLAPRRAGRARLVRGRRRDRLLPRARPPGRDAAHRAGQRDGGRR